MYIYFFICFSYCNCTIKRTLLYIRIWFIIYQELHISIVNYVTIYTIFTYSVNCTF